MKKKNYIFRKTHEIDKEKFASLLMAAKGGRTMKDFAEMCGANPSTFTRITQMANKGASSTELLEAIATHAAPESGVTIEALAEANGYTCERDIGVKALKLSTTVENIETQVRNVLVQALLDRNEEVRLGSFRYDFSKSLSLSPDALIMTNAFGGENEVWFVDSIIGTPRWTQKEGNPIHKSRVKQMAFDRFSRFTFISMSKNKLFRPTRFSLAVIDPEVYDIIVEEFSETAVPTDISVILIDTLNSCIAKEYMLPHTEKGQLEAYFMSTEAVVDDRDYLRAETFDEDE